MHPKVENHYYRVFGSQRFGDSLILNREKLFREVVRMSLESHSVERNPDLQFMGSVLLIRLPDLLISLSVKWVQSHLTLRVVLRVR